jgi:hypothetical protein
MNRDASPTSEQRFVENGADLFVFEESEEGKKYRIPYHIIKRAVFSGLKREELIDVQHSARLQYRLMLLESVIKAIVDFNDLEITVMYNPTGADNNSAKMSIEQLTEFLAQEGVHADQGGVKNEDYDYYKHFYSYAYSSPSIRKSAPYSYTLDEWKRLEPEFIKKTARANEDKLAKFRAWQKKYLKEKAAK